MKIALIADQYLLLCKKKHNRHALFYTFNMLELQNVMMSLVCPLDRRKKKKGGWKLNLYNLAYMNSQGLNNSVAPSPEAGRNSESARLTWHASFGFSLI